MCTQALACPCIVREYYVPSRTVVFCLHPLHNNVIINPHVHAQRGLLYLVSVWGGVSIAIAAMLLKRGHLSE